MATWSGWFERAGAGDHFVHFCGVLRTVPSPLHGASTKIRSNCNVTDPPTPPAPPPQIGSEEEAPPSHRWSLVKIKGGWKSRASPHVTIALEECCAHRRLSARSARGLSRSFAMSTPVPSWLHPVAPRLEAATIISSSWLDFDAGAEQRSRMASVARIGASKAGGSIDAASCWHSSPVAAARETSSARLLPPPPEAALTARASSPNPPCASPPNPSCTSPPNPAAASTPAPGWSWEAPAPGSNWKALPAGIQGIGLAPAPTAKPAARTSAEARPCSSEARLIRTLSGSGRTSSENAASHWAGVHSRWAA
mmetsp:Transcript_20203/g.51395  ORF Transcript_20203/g.51395 Transcript_20203/m.51395 type:complete len:309 (+) Transcript_20203:1858-2784(+)